MFMSRFYYLLINIKVFKEYLPIDYLLIDIKVFKYLPINLIKLFLVDWMQLIFIFLINYFLNLGDLIMIHLNLIFFKMFY